MGGVSGGKLPWGRTANVLPSACYVKSGGEFADAYAFITQLMELSIAIIVLIWLGKEKG